MGVTSRMLVIVKPTAWSARSALSRPEPTYEKPDISVRATTLYYQIVAPIMLPLLERRLLNLFRCREGKCFFQRNREHPPTGKEFDSLVHFEPVLQKNGRTEKYLYVESAEEIASCALVVFFGRNSEIA